jgi:hypothetical protein
MARDVIVKRALAMLALGLVLVPLAVSVLMPIVERPVPTCEFYAVPLRFVSVMERPPRRSRDVRLPDVEFSYELDGRRYTSSRLSCWSASPGADRNTVWAFSAAARRETTAMVAWVPANDHAGGCISLAQPFRYSLLNEVAAACRR